MKTKFLSLLLALSLLLTPAFAEEADPAAEETAKPVFSVAQQESIIRSYAHTLADNYYYGATDQNILYNVICATIENGGVFDLDRALEAMVISLDDDYGEYYSPEAFDEQTRYYDAEFFGIGVVITVYDGGTVIDTVYSGSAAEAAGLKAGDRLMLVDGVDVSNMPPAKTRELIVGEEGSAVDITVLRGEELISVRAVRQRVSESHSSMAMLDGGIAYIRVESFTSSLPEEFDAYLDEIVKNDVQKVILDLRDNGGGDLDAAIAVSQKLISAGIIAKIKYKNEALNEDVYSDNLNAPRFKMLVLVNEHTASASEFLAMALQSAGRAKLLGERTYGKGCMQMMVRTPTGSGMKFTIGEFFTPKDERIHTVGLTPDIPVSNIVVPVEEKNLGTIVLDNLAQPSTKLGVEQRLNLLGLLADSYVDGYYDGMTEAAVRVFQEYSNLEVTGEVDFYTALAINDFGYEGAVRVQDVQMEKALEYFGAAPAQADR